MTATELGPVWIHPPRFWKATQGKSEDEVAALLDHINSLLTEGKIETLLQFDFVTGVGYPYPHCPVGDGAKKSAA
jgi:hypothetical protein